MSTEGALHCAHRSVDRALAERGGCLHVLARDWQKESDSINTEAILNALRRFGLPPNFVTVVRSIYTGRQFVVNESGEESLRSRQDSGICQGRPLSPFLFIIAMTLLMHDAKGMLSAPCRTSIEKGHLFDVLYADDTLLIGCHAPFVEEFARAVEQAGSTYGMTLYWGKTQALSAGTKSCLRKPDGTLFEDVGVLQYLGGLISADGRFDSELSRKLGMAKSDFNQLQRLWSHASVSLKDKIGYLDSFIFSKLRYGFATVWLVRAQRRRLDGLYGPMLASSSPHPSGLRLAGVECDHFRAR